MPRYSVAIAIVGSYITEVEATDEEDARVKGLYEANREIEFDPMNYLTLETDDISEIESPYVPPEHDHD